MQTQEQTDSADNGLSEAQVAHIARLSMLALDAAQLKRYQSELSRILGYVRMLESVDVEGVEPLTHVGDEANVLDKDVAGEVLSHEVAMGLAPETAGPYLLVPRVMGEG